MADDNEEKETVRSSSCRRSVRRTSVNSYVVQRNAKVELREKVKKVTEILKKADNERTAAEKALVKKHPDIVKTSQKNAQRLQANKDRVLEIEDEPQILDQKCDQLADLIRCAERIVVYTGAGISTAASIPDYRGPNGVWTLLKKGQEPSAQDLSDAEPTFTHMSITKLFRAGLVKHIVSQNCDGLHIRSGYPRYALSEVHGNMYIECCYSCNPHKEYIRLFDVTERTGVRRHKTGRRCRTCGSLLTDTIVHFGEKGQIKSPYRWKEAVRAAKNSDLILCLGSSLKILRRYTCLWAMDRKPHQRPKLVIVNLQWTPKDDGATLKINGRCDYVMKRVMNELENEVPEYRRETDPIFKLCTPLRASELKTTSKKVLVPPFLPAKTPSKVTKKSRQKKSRSHNIKLEKRSSKSEVKEESSSGVKSESNLSHKDSLPFPEIFRKSEIKADWDTPILAVELSDPLSSPQYKEEKPDKIYDLKTEPSSLLSEVGKGCLIKPVIDSKTHVNSFTNMKLEPKDKIHSEDFSEKKYQVIDFVLTDENSKGFIDNFQPKSDGVTMSNSANPTCPLELSEKIQQTVEVENCNTDKDLLCSLSCLKDESFHTPEYTNESVQLTQPLPGTVVINLEVVDDVVDNFSTGRSESAQVGTSLDNILLINLDSDQLNKTSCIDEESGAQDSFSFHATGSDSDLQELMTSTSLNVAQQQSPVFHVSFDSPMKMSHNNNADFNLLVPNVSPSSLSLTPSPLTNSKTSPQLLKAQRLDPPLAISAVATSSGSHLKSPPVNDKPVTLSFQQHSFLSKPELPLAMPHASPSKSQPQDGQPSTLPVMGTLISPWPAPSLSDTFSSRMQSVSNFLTTCTAPQMSTLSNINKQTEVRKSKNYASKHENLLQLLNKPVQKHPSNSLQICLAAKQVISSSGPVKSKAGIIEISDHPSHQMVKSKEHTTLLGGNSVVTSPPIRKFLKQEEVRNASDHTLQVACKPEKISSLLSPVSQVTSSSGSYKDKWSTAGYEPSKMINTFMYTKPVEKQNSSLPSTANKTVNESPILTNGAKSNAGSVPLCVLNMDDLIQPKVDSTLSPKPNLEGIANNSILQKKVLPQETTQHRSLSPFQGVSLITTLSSPSHESQHENVFEETLQISTKISHVIGGNVSEKESTCNAWTMKEPHQANKMEVGDLDTENRKEADSSALTDLRSHDAIRPHFTKDHTTSRKRPITPAVSQSVKLVTHFSPVQSENNKKKDSKSRNLGFKVGVDRSQSNKSKKVASESVSAPGWFGKGLAIKIKRKKKS